MTLWSGRVGTGLDPEVAAFLQADDAELLPYDIRGELVHARRLYEAGLLDGGRAGRGRAPARRARVGARRRGRPHADRAAASARWGGSSTPAGRGTTRSRPRCACTSRTPARRRSRRSRRSPRPCSTAPRSEAETPMPGYTHLQRAQPVTVGHHLLAWVEMLERDRARFRFAAGAGGAVSARLGRARRARRCRCRRPPASRRGTRSTPSPTATSRSTTCTPARCWPGTSPGSARSSVLWASSEFGFVRLPEEAATGSSMMPQKLNPDVAELVRGKAGTALGRLTGLLAVVKGLPLAYDRDLQEDKAPVFAARRDVRGVARGPARARRRARVRPRAPRRGVLRSRAAGDGRGRAARPRGRAVSRGARAGGRGDPERDVRRSRGGGAACRSRPGRRARGARGGPPPLCAVFVTGP